MSCLKNKVMDKNKEKKQKKKAIQGLPVLKPYAAGADIGDTRHDIAINDGKGGHIVRTFKTFTADVEEAVTWLKEEGVTTVAMESTGVYYLTFYLMLEEAGIEPYLVNARHVKNVTGRKKDETDAMWIQRLHSCGLLQNCFQPDNDFRTLRTYVRQRKGLITRSSDEVRRMQKALELMNIKIHIVISDILGKTGMQIIKAIIDGNYDAIELSKLKDPRIKATQEEIIKSLQGIWKEEYLFTLEQAYNTYFFYQQQIKECEKKIHEHLIKQIGKSNQGDITLDQPMKKKNRAGQTLRMATISLASNKTPLGDYYRRMKSKYGGRGAALAAAHKLARIIFKMLETKEEFSYDMLIESQKKYREIKIKQLEKQLERLKKAA
jgi:transposase